jgi:hypothetical protein
MIRLLKEVSMKKPLNFIHSGYEEAPALEAQLCEMLLSRADREAKQLCLDISDFYRNKFPDEKHMVITDVNPLFKLAKGNSRQILKRLQSLKLPLCPDGLVVMQDNHDLTSMGMASGKFLGNLPSWQQSAYALKGKSALFNISSKSSINLLIGFYRAEREIDLLADEPMVELLSKSGFSFANIRFWGMATEELVSHELTRRACLKTLGVSALISKLVKGDLVNCHDYLGIKNKDKCEHAALFLLKSLERQPFQSALSEQLIKECAYLKMNDIQVNDKNITMHAHIGGVGFGLASGFFPSVLDYFCLTLSRFCKTNPERIFAQVVEGALRGEAKNFKLFHEGVNTALSVPVCSRELAKKDMMAEAFKALRWTSLLGDLDHRAKKQILNDELGL